MRVESMIERVMFLLVIALVPAVSVLPEFMVRDNITTSSSWLADVPPPLRSGETLEQRIVIDQLLEDHWRHSNPYQNRDKGKHFTYGEVTPLGSRQVLQAMGLWNTSTAVLYDLGSGTGKFVVQAFLEHAAIKVVGIELSQSRHEMAVQAWDSVLAAIQNHSSMNSHKESTVEFRHQDLLDADFSDATHIYTCSLCFPAAVVTRLSQRILAIGASLQTVAALSDLWLVEETGNWNKNVHEIQTTWGRGRLRVYQRRR